MQVFCTLPYSQELSEDNMACLSRLSRNWAYCAYHVLVQPNIWRYYFYFWSDQAPILLDHFNVLDEL